MLAEAEIPADPFCQGLEPALGQFSVFRVQGSDGPFCKGGVRDDVGSRAAFYMADPYDQGMEGRTVAADDGLGCCNELAQHDHRVCAELGPAGMAPFALERNLEFIHGSVHEPGPGDDGALLICSTAVEPEDYLHIVQDPGIQDLQGSVQFLFRRLEDQFQCAGDGTAGFQGQGCPQEIGRMEVMAAGVHPSRDFRLVGEAGLFLEGQGVDVAAQGCHRTIAVPQVSHHPGFQRQIIKRDPLMGQEIFDMPGGLEFFTGQFRPAVELVKLFFCQCDDRFIIHIHISPLHNGLGFLCRRLPQPGSLLPGR